MELLAPLNWKDYELLDVGDFSKLERWGDYVTIRPEPQAVWAKKLSDREWQQQAHVRFVPKSSSSGSWEKLKKMPDNWNIAYHLDPDKKLKFKLALTSFKHVGLFPEQADNWDFIYSTLKKMPVETPKVLNLFAYTGGASLAAKAAGADTVHVDSIKQVVSWSRENMELSGLNNIRWVVEDALKFVTRELKRGNKYNGIILDPPAYGHGPNGEKWKLEDNIKEMINGVLGLLDEKNHFLILNAYSLGFSSLIIENLLKGKKSKLSTGELYIPSKSGLKLPLGVFGRLSTV